MDSTYKKEKWSLDTVSEIISDLFCFDLILEIKRKLKNEEAKEYIVTFLRILAPIYIHEIINAVDHLGIVPKNETLDSATLKRINAERQLSAHKVIVNSKKAIEAIEDMEISFDRKVYDINIVVKNGILYDMNYELQVAPVDDFDFWNHLFSLPYKILTAVFSALSPDYSIQEIFDNCSERLDLIANQLDEELSFSRYSYSTHKLFQNSINLEIPDKTLILYRYRMITSVNVLSNYLPSFHITFGEKRIVDMNSFFEKYKALIIEIMKDELNQLDTPFGNQIKADIKNAITDTRFFSLNRKLRNNLHYETTNILTTDELDMIRINQMNYLSIFENNFRKHLYIDIDEECKVMTGFSKAFRKSGMPKEELDRRYSFYYLKYCSTGEL